MKTIDDLIRENREKECYNMLVRSLLEILKQRYEWYQGEDDEDEINRKALVSLATDLSKLAK